jgi:pilus assembly protein CpaB
MDKRFMTVLGMSVLLALLVSGIFYQITVRANSPRKEKYDTKELVVATADMPLGATVKPTDLHIVRWPADTYPKGGFSKVEDVVDRAVISNVLADEPLVAGRLSEKNAGVGLSSVIPPGMRAVSVAVNNVIGVAGFVLPGSRVDVLVTGSPASSGGSDNRMTSTVLEHILVISAGTKIQADGRGQAENVPVVTMLVTPEQAELLTLAATEGRIQLVLRNPTDEKAQKPSSVRVATLYTGAAPETPKPTSPRPRPVKVETAVVTPPPPPPAPIRQEVEMIRGDKRAVETVGFEKPGQN